MNRLITEFLAIFLVMLCSIAAIAEAQPMDKNHALIERILSHSGGSLPV